MRPGLNVVFVVPSFHTNLFFATKALKQAGVGVHILCANAAGAEDHSEVRPVILDQATTRWSDLYKRLGEIRPDLVVIRDVGRISKMIFWISLVQRRPMIGYDQRPFLKPRHWGRLLHGFARGRPLRRITPVHGLWEPGGRADRFATYMPFPVEGIGEAEPRRYCPDGVVRILCVGKLAERRKNQLLLLQSLEPLAAEFDFRITLAGSASLQVGAADRAYLESLLSYAESGALRNRLTIIKDVPFSDMARLYADHDICVLPSKKEPLGTAPLEAMGRGCAAIISSDSGSAYYVAEAEEAGLPCGALFSSGSEAGLRLVLRNMLDNPERIAALGQNAIKWVQRRFSLAEFANRFIALMAEYDRTGTIARSRRIDGDIIPELARRPSIK
jgi:hypothetical protein